jgi:hypothetical protein
MKNESRRERRERRDEDDEEYLVNARTKLISFSGAAAYACVISNIYL